MPTHVDRVEWALCRCGNPGVFVATGQIGDTRRPVRLVVCGRHLTRAVNGLLARGAKACVVAAYEGEPWEARR